MIAAVSRWRVVPPLWLVATILLAAPPLVLGRYWTNDGPAHLTMARLLVHGAAGPVQDALYLVGMPLAPNLAGYPVAGILIPLLGPDRAEAVWQALALAAIPASCAFALAMLDARARGVAGLAAAFALSQMFFLGLYNYILSISAFLVVVGVTVRANRDGGRWWAALAVALVVAFLCHAAGFLAAVLFVAAWSLPSWFQAWRAGSAFALLRAAAWTILAVLPAGVLGLLYLGQQGGGGMAFGPTLSDRFAAFQWLQIFAPHGGGMRHGGRILALVTFAAAAAAAFYRAAGVLRARKVAADDVRWLLALGAAFAVALGMPDDIGGGWSHFRRTIAIAMLTLVLFAGAHLPRWAGYLAGLGGLAILVVQTTAAVTSRARLAPVFAAAERVLSHIPSGCSVAPLILQPRLEPTTSFEPLFHVASQVELQGGRVALFNFLARLKNYPVRYRPGRDPSVLLYGWQPEQRATAIAGLDVPGWESATGIPVDYVLLQGPLDAAPVGVRAGLSGFVPVPTEASAEPFVLLRREQPSAGCRGGRM